MYILQQFTQHVKINNDYLVTLLLTKKKQSVRYKPYRLTKESQMASTPQPQRMSHEQRRIRAKIIAEDYKANQQTMEQLGVKYGLTASRVQQIVKPFLPRKRGGNGR